MAGAAKKNPALKRNQPNRTGRPTAYKPEYCDLVVKIGKQGKSITAMANVCGVHRDTLYEWAEVHPAFSDALTRARGHSLEWWESTAQGQARGKYDGANGNTLAFMLKNQHPDQYRDRREIDHSGELRLVEIDFSGFEGDADDGTD